MRGFASFILVALAALTALQLMALRTESLEQHSFFESKALALERRHYDGLYLKQGLRQALQTGIPDRKLAVALASQRLAEFEKFAENENMELWAGYIDDADIATMRDNTLINNRPAKCGACFDLSDTTLDEENKIAYKTISLLDGISNVKVSHNGLANLNLPSLGKRPTIGATIYYPEEKIAAVEIAEEGFPK